VIVVRDALVVLPAEWEPAVAVAEEDALIVQVKK